LNITLLLTHVAEWLGVIAVAWFLALIPRFRVEPVGFKYARRDGIMALALGATAVIFAYALTTPQLRDLALRFVPVQAAAAELANPFLIAALSLLPVLAALFMRGQPARSAGWGRAGLRAGLQIGLALALLTILLRNRALDLIHGINSVQAAYLLLALGIAFAEETIFRGYLQLRLGWWLGRTQGWLVTGLIYAAFRLPVILITSDSPALPLNLIIALGQGLVAGWLMRKSGHVLAPALYRAVSIWMNVFI
jgi:membrane protease YdiL (CAAX protease family)